MKQLIVLSPMTGRERKVDAYTVMTESNFKGVHWRDQLGIEYVRPLACKPLPGDDAEDAQAKFAHTWVNLLMPKDMRNKLDQVKMPRNLSIVKHVQDEGVMVMRPPDVEKLREMLKQCEIECAEEAEGSDSEKPKAIEASGSVQSMVPSQVHTDRKSKIAYSNLGPKEKVQYKFEQSQLKEALKESIKNTPEVSSKMTLSKIDSGSGSDFSSDDEIVARPEGYGEPAKHKIQRKFDEEQFEKAIGSSLDELTPVLGYESARPHKTKPKQSKKKSGGQVNKVATETVKL